MFVDRQRATILRGPNIDAAFNRIVDDDLERRFGSASAGRENHKNAVSGHAPHARFGQTKDDVIKLMAKSVPGLYGRGVFLAARWLFRRLATRRHRQGVPVGGRDLRP